MNLYKYTHVHVFHTTTQVKDPLNVKNKITHQKERALFYLHFFFKF